MKAEFESRADASQYKVTWSKNVHNFSATYESAVIKLGNSVQNSDLQLSQT